MKIMINQKEVSQARIEQWRKQRILKAAKMLNLQLHNTDKTEILDQALLKAKMKLTYEELIHKIGTKLKWSQYLMKWAAKWSKKPRKKAIITIFESGLTAASFSIMLEKLMLEKTNVHKRVNLGACPDSLIKEHQFHLAAEWSRWIAWCRERKE